MSSYKIGNIPIEVYGFTAGCISSSSGEAYALTGTMSLPKRTGKTHHNWGDSIEPYVDANDMTYDVRDFELSLTARAANIEELNERLNTFYTALGNSFTLTNDLQGSFEVIPIEGKVIHYSNGWGMTAIQLRELSPMRYADLRALPTIITPASEGIDGYSWQDLGLVVGGLDNRYDLTQFQPLQLTAENHACGSRAARTVTLKGTIKAGNYADLKTKVEVLHALIGGEGTRTIRYFDDTTREAFAVDGIKIDKVMKFGSTTHWAHLECKLIELI